MGERPQLYVGYWGDSDATDKVLLNGWLRTGDLARCIDGFYWFSGRLKHIIIRNGDNISPSEIEDVLTQHPAVNAVGVIGIPHPIEGAVPNAFVELKQGQKATANDLIDFAKEHLENSKVPTAIFIIDKLPRTLSGKIAQRGVEEPSF